jgi:hypothetical protein
LLAAPEEIARFDFNPNAVQQRRLQQHFGVAMNYRDWCQQKKKSLNWLSAQHIVSGDIVDMSILLAPIKPSALSETKIAAFRPTTGTRSVKLTTQVDREKDNRSNQRAGQTAEHRVVMASAQNLLASQDKPGQWAEVRRVWALVRGEFDHLDDLPVNCPGADDPHELVHVLHVAAKFGDGLGFDVIEVGDEPGQVWLAEVKSAAGGRLFLSENERLKAFRYETILPGCWRLKVWQGDGKWGNDQLTASVLAAFKYVGTRLEGNDSVRPEGWVFQLS